MSPTKPAAPKFFSGGAAFRRWLASHHAESNGLVVGFHRVASGRGGLTYAEMGSMFPRSGGLYVFLSEAYGPVWGFLFGIPLVNYVFRHAIRFPQDQPQDAT